MYTINVTPKIYKRLERHALGFEDTPANVIERLLNHYERHVKGEPVPGPIQKRGSATAPRDYTHYVFEGRDYGKSRLVLAVIKAYVRDHPNTTFRDLLEAFPKNLQGSSGVFDKLQNVKVKDPERRFFIKDPIELADCTVFVCTQWGIGNISQFIDTATKLGYTIEPTPQN
ncbi:MAG: hypothetical protein OXF52_02395 [Candidatus Dadabacteria bacterium]|nr:hypothetical protein [Candidatus Dadabacteria bacterium]